MKIELLPLKGLNIDGKEILFGDSKEKIRGILGEGEENDNLIYFEKSSLMMEFNEDDKLQFAEASRKEEFEVILANKDIFRTKENELLEFFKNELKAKGRFSENMHCLTFFDLSMGLYRELTPFDIEDMEKEMKENGIDGNNDHDFLEDKKKSEYWETCGIGIKNYYE